jgi:HEAT repeat protein
MAVAIRCDECGRVYHLRADGEITQIECSCGAVLRVPIEGTPRVIAPAPPPPPAASPAVAAWRRGGITIAGAAFAGALLAWLASLASDLNLPLWSLALPRVAPWAWFAAPAAGVAVLSLLRRTRRPDSFSAAAAVVVAALVSIGLVLLLHHLLTDTWRLVVRGAVSGATWGHLWPLIGALAATLAAGLASGLTRALPEAASEEASPSGRARALAGVTGAVAGIAAFGAARGIPGLIAGSTEGWTEPTTLAALAVLFAIVGGALAVAALDFGLQQRAGRTPLAGALAGVVAGAIVEPLLDLHGTTMLVVLIALPIAGGLAGMAAGLAVAAGGRSRRHALIGLAGVTAAIIAGAVVYAPSSEALRVRMLIAQAGASGVEAHEAIAQLRAVEDPSAIRALAAGLRHGQGEVQQACAMALARTDHPRACKVLLGYLDHEDPMVRRYAIRGVARAGDTRAVRTLRRMVASDDANVARDGAWGLAILQDDAGLQELLKIARSPERMQRVHALSALGPLVASKPEARRAVLEAFADSDPAVRVAAVSQIDEIAGDDAYERVSAMLNDPEPTVRRAAIRSLSAMGDPRATEALVTALMSGAVGMMQPAADGLGRIATPEAIAALKRATRSSDPEIVRFAANGLGVAGTPEAVAVLREMLVREATADSYEAWTSNALLNKPGLDPSPLVPLIEHEDKRVRDRIAQLLPTLLRDRPELIVPYLAHNRPETRLVALRVLSREETQVDPEVAVLLLGDANEAVRAAAVAFFGTHKERSAPVLIQALQRPQTAVAAAEALGQIGEREALVPLTDALRHGPPEAKRSAARALGRLGVTELTGEFVTMLQTGDALTRVAAIEALGWLKEPRAVEPLIGALSDTNPEARRAASDALAAIGRPAVAPLAKLADSQDEWIREGSRRALGSIDDPDARQARATWLP